MSENELQNETPTNGKSISIKVKNDDGPTSTLDVNGKEVSRTAAATSKMSEKVKEAAEETDPETDETCTEIVTRAEIAVQCGKFAEAGNAFQRAANLAGGEERTLLVALAEQYEGQANEKDQSTSKKVVVNNAVTAQSSTLKNIVNKAAAVKTVVVKKPNKRKTPSAPKKGSVQDGSMDPVAVAELSPNIKKVFLSVEKGKTVTIGEIQERAFPNLPHARGSSWVRNQLRFLRVHRMFELLGEGKYRRIA